MRAENLVRSFFFCPRQYGSINNMNKSIEIFKVEEPVKPDETKGWKGRPSYKITDMDSVIYFGNPDKVKNLDTLKAGDKINIEYNSKDYSGKTMNFINDFSLDSGVDVANSASNNSSNYHVEEGTAGGHDVSELVGRDWSIILQSCVNRFANWTPDQKLHWFLLNYSRGSSGAFKHLQNTDDLDNQAIDDEIPNNF
jgi:hypothetical protein